MPLASILSTKFEQPFLGQNYLIVEIKPAADGGLTNGTKAEIRLRDKGLFEFASSLDKTRERAIYMKRSGADEEEGLRMFIFIDMVYPKSNNILSSLSRLFYPVEFDRGVRRI